MKNLFKTLGIIALVAVIGFTMTACPPEPKVQDVVGATLSLIDKPVTIDSSATGCSATNFGYLYVDDFIPPDPLSDYINGSPSVTLSGNKLTVKLGAVNSTELYSIYSSSSYNGVTKTPSDAKGFSIGEFDNETGYYYLQIWNGSDSTNGQAYLVYMDKDVTLSGTRTSGSTTYTYNNVSLKQGWNYLIYSDRTGTTGNYQRTVTAGRTLPSGYNWVLYSVGDPALNGTWEATDADGTTTLTVTNGTIEMKIVDQQHGTYIWRGSYIVYNDTIDVMWTYYSDNGTTFETADLDTYTYSISGSTLTLTQMGGSQTFTKK
jgi:hypothetical protein